jgi:hypothetical protein
MYSQGQRVLDRMPPEHRAHLMREAERLQVPLEVAVAMLHQESAGREDALSPKGAYGYMQLMPGTARELGVDMSDPLQNITGGLTYLRRQMNAFGSLPLALAAYNAGPGAVSEYGGIPPYAETQDYVKKILGRVGLDENAAPTGQNRGVFGALPERAQERIQGVREAFAPTPEGEPAPGVFGRLDRGLGALFGRGESGPEGPDTASVERLREALASGDISQDTYEQMYARLLLEPKEDGRAMGLMNLSDYLLNSYEPPRLIGSSLSTTPLRGSSGSGTSAIQRLGVRPLA